MHAIRQILNIFVLSTVGCLIFCYGCTNQRTVPPLFTSAPQQELPDDPVLLEVPQAPAPISIPLSIQIPRQETLVNPKNSVMRQGSVIKSGSSVVISVPASIYQQIRKSSDGETPNKLWFRTDGYFNVLEQYIERGLILVGFNVKDRSKFEAKLRDLRDSGDVIRSSDSSYSIALSDLKKKLDAGKLTSEEFVEQSKQLRDKLLDPYKGSYNREEMTDISEVIRAAQDGDVMADYVLQVNEGAVEHYSGEPLQLGVRPEVQKVIRENPRLRIGSAGENNTIPATLEQPWAQARFNAKLIDVKTGIIDWTGEYSIDSLAVLNDGVQIIIGIRKRPSNAKSIIGGIESYNNQLRSAYQKVIDEKRKLDSAYYEAMRSVTYEGSRMYGENIQVRRRREVEQAENLYLHQLSEYKRIAQYQPPEMKMDWIYDYDVDDPVVIPDLSQPQTKEEERRKDEHVKDLGAKVTYDLLSTIKMSDSNIHRK